jgi:hypothetical protein
MAEEPRERAESSATAPSPDSGGEDHQLRRRRRGLLRMYYGVENEQSKEQDNPVDIDKAGFQPPVFMEKILKECSLNELYKKEERMKREIQELDSNMQYLVYENHSKFIKASETIREMKDDFQRLEDDMTHLGSRMEEITTASDSINRALADRKREIVKLCGVHHLLKKLQFLFELPSRLNKCMEMGFYAQAVKTYVKASHVLAQYQHMPSFSGIHSDCQSIVARLKTDLKNRLDDPNSTTSMTAETVDLLLALNEPPSQLCHQFLDNSRRQLEKDLAVIAAESEKEGKGGAMEIVEYVNVVCSGFLANLSLVIQSCYDMFVKRHLMSTETEELKRSEVAQQTLFGTSRQWPTGEGCGQTEWQTAGHEQTAPCSWTGASEQAADSADSRVAHLLPRPATAAEFLRHAHRRPAGPGHRPATLLPTRRLSQRPLHGSLCLHQEWTGVLSRTTQGLHRADSLILRQETVPGDVLSLSGERRYRHLLHQPRPRHLP